MRFIRIIYKELPFSNLFTVGANAFDNFLLFSRSDQVGALWQLNGSIDGPTD